MGYGTGAIMAVPSGDERDFDFARAYNLDRRDSDAARRMVCEQQDRANDGLQLVAVGICRRGRLYQLVEQKDFTRRQTFDERRNYVDQRLA